MTDIALSFTGAGLAADLALSGGDIATDDGLQTAVIVSLFTDRRARVDDPLPQDGGDRRGWWGDCANDDPADRIGSRLWLLERSKLTEAVATRAREYAREALDWMIADGVAVAVDVASQIVRPNALGLVITITRPDGSTRRIAYLWDATARSIAAA